MLQGFGVAVATDDGEITIEGGQELRATQISVPGDISSAAFFLVGAALCEGSELRLRGVGVNPTRFGVIDILREMGADIEISDEHSTGTEPVADILVRGAPLHGIDIPPASVPSAIDEFPALFVAAACAEGTTRLVGANELRHKESDRIDAMTAGLHTLGVAATPRDDGIEIAGRPDGPGGGLIDSRGDHRVAMAFAMAGLKASAPIEIRGCRAIATSFPGFLDIAREAGLRIAPA
jgi:3-phosphoshikimate 1-carboxyvinyltransferase